MPEKSSWTNEHIDFTRKQDLYRLRQQIGMIFQDFNLFDHLTALDNITIALRKVKKMGKKEAEAAGPTGT